MTYTKYTWTDTTGQIKYTITDDGDYKILTPNYEDAELGTPVNATNMNHIEQGIEDCYTDLVKRKSTSQATGDSTTPVYVKADGTVEVCERGIEDTRFNGQWVNSLHTLSTSKAKGTYTIDISSYLPDDNYKYDVQLVGYAYHSGDGNKYQTVTSSIITESTAFNMVGSYADRSRSSIILPVGTNRQITYDISAGLSGASLVMVAYMRIGTNQ